MFGNNLVFGPKDYTYLGTDSVRVTSIFVTLQGEGPYSGQLAIFVRLTGCNLRCSFCDTFFDAGINMHAVQVLADAAGEFNKRLLPIPRLMVITGGEPMMQPGLPKLVDTAQRAGMKVQIETNGNFYQPISSDATIVVSPKVNEATGKYVKVHPATLMKARALKFVVSARMAGYQQVPQWALEWRGANYGGRSIYLSPMNEYIRKPEPDEVVSFWTPGLLDHAMNKANHEHAAKLAMQHDCILSLQQHIYASLP